MRTEVTVPAINIRRDAYKTTSEVLIVGMTAQQNGYTVIIVD